MRIYNLKVEQFRLLDLPVDLPCGVVIIGGAARAMARLAVTGEFEPVRDIDLGYMPRITNVEASVLDNLAWKYAPEDASHGHGVQVVKSVSHYLRTRDFTINESLVVGKRLILSEECEDDLIHNRIRLSSFEEDNGEMNRLSCKAIYLAASLERLGIRADCGWADQESCYGFQFCLFAEKAYQRNALDAYLKRMGASRMDLKETG